MRDKSESRSGDSAPVTPVAILSPVRIVAELLQEGLAHDDGLSVIATGATAEQLRREVKHTRDVVLLVDGTAREYLDSPAEVLRSLDFRAVLVFGLIADASALRRSLDAGVRGALGLEATRADLRRAIGTVAANEVFLSSSLVALLSRPKTALSWRPALTPREKEVAQHLAKGESNAEIARELGLSRATVKAHVGRVLSKLDISSRRDVSLGPQE